MTAIRPAYAVGFLKMLFIEGDTTTIRVLLGVASLGWTIGLWVQPLGTFERPIFIWMRAVANEWVWGGLFLLHFVGVFWRLIDTIERKNWAMAVNMLGFALWAASTSAQILAVGEYTPSTSLEIVATIALFVVMLRTGRNREIRTV